MTFSRRPSITANEIRLKRSQHIGAFGVVEGPDDKLFYSRFIDQDKCKLVVAYGKENVLDVIRLLDTENFRGVFGMVDLDFDAINRISVDTANIIHGDCHDVEAMLIRSPAFDHVLREFGSEDKITRFCDRMQLDVRTVLHKAVMPLAYLRLHSKRTGLNLKFENLRFSEFIHRDSLEMNLTALITAVKNNSQRQDISSEALRAGIAELNDVTHNPWQLCNGHDLVGVFSFALRSSIGSERAANVRVENLTTSLRLAYNESDFSESAQYQRIREWELANAQFRIFT